MPNYLDVLQSPNRPKIGVAISSGGPKAAAGAELFDFLEAATIPIDYLAGCSGGSVTCGMKAVGYTAQEIREAWTTMSLRKPFKPDLITLAALMNLPFSRFVKGRALFKKDPLLDIFKMLYGQHTLIEETKIPLSIQTTNIDTGLGVVQTSGLIHEAIYASSAAMPFFPPINIKGQWFADGYFSSSIPILPLVAKGVDIIIVLNVQPYSLYHESYAKSGYSYFACHDNFLQMSIANSTRFQNSLAVDQHFHEIIFIDVPLEDDVALWETEKIPYVFEKGKEAVNKVKHSILEAISSFKCKEGK